MPAYRHSPTDNSHRYHRSSETMESPTSGTISREECPRETGQFECAREQNRADHDEERPMVSCATANESAPMEVVVNHPVNATEGGQLGGPFEDAVDEDNELAEANANLVRQVEERSREHNTTMREKREIAQAYAALKQDYEAQRNQNKALRRDNESLRARLEQRTSELSGVERFFTTADKFSGSEVVSMLRKLNEGVQQSGTFMAEWAVRNLKFEAPHVHQTSTSVDEQTKASGLLGAQFMRVLKMRKHVDNPILVEIAFQAYLMCELCAAASQRSTQGSDNAFIDGIYQRMREAEGQAISGNWRALTHRYYAAFARTEGPEFMHKAETTIVYGLSDILLAVGCTNSTYDITSALRSKFADKIRDFISLARDINMIIGAGVISDDLEILLVRPETPFDGKVMQDWDDDGKGQGIPNGMVRPRETVLCTIELGLMKRTRAAAAGKRSEVMNSIMVKPKVALVSILDFI